MTKKRQKCFKKDELSHISPSPPKTPHRANMGNLGHKKEIVREMFYEMLKDNGIKVYDTARTSK